MIKTIHTWRQDLDKEEGAMTFCFGHGDVTCRFNSFSEANKLAEAIQKEIREVRRDARATLLSTIARIEP